MNYSTKKTKRLVQLGLFMALIILQTWVPMLGNINIPPLSITFIHVTVIIATLWLGTYEGMAVGLMWGLNSLLRAYIQPVSPLHILVFTSPLVSVLPRVLMPLIVGNLANFFRSQKLSKNLVGMLSGVAGSLLNTIFVLGAIALFKQADYLQIKEITQPELWAVLGSIVVVNGVPEAIAAGIVTPAIYRALDHKKQ
ncbi:ECF transporter S component [Aerococcaceae bacterium NML191292]|nr:ECF transporter S component [Aerococcaceae bacterium NML210727]MCW6655403.1 ECF transporter S component [Aerococcaceae bacterium NML201296]MCW6660426.1 ECF transporter S component [Aerococcaceae bacterium NML191292]MCW6661710.1 ECF transporter S component [Aerococcaceae bacterium NML201209]MCW6663855.1 ECF transporter S component [Aerococcaceae bacterium NML190073]MCW6665127.1 ECF transporter S component [Aerococcaceae bacterium NML191219]MCW6667438.1 ECF transporter S component [Aerococca